MGPREILRYYSREDIQKALLKISDKREVVGVYKDGGFSKRPNTLVYPNDITTLVKGGAVAFHGSLERWTNPMAVGSENYESTRSGWDLILDIDCQQTDHGKVTVKVFLDALKTHGIKNVSLKFTGGTGFHMGIPFESLPSEVDYRKTKEQYPEMARKIAQYLKNFAFSKLEQALLDKWSIEQLSEQTGKPVGSIMTDNGIDPYTIANVDPILISPRHLFRLPYSLHEKNHLVSLPLRPEDLDGFRKEDASPEKAVFRAGFLDTFQENEAATLVVEGLDWWAKQKRAKVNKAKRMFNIKSAVPIQLAPPCIQNILKGLTDGRKRSLFILMNYLSSLKWDWDQIETFLVKWNEKNRQPLRESYLRGQVKWHRNRQKALPPPNCDNLGYYENFDVCKPDDLCGGSKKSIKNPINYAVKKLKKK